MSVSVTKHDYDQKRLVKTNGKNEIANGKIQAISSTSDSFDWVKKEAVNQQRKLRLNQVRQQSKEIASQIRENVRDEKQRQLEAVNKIKQNELLNWRQKQIGQTESDYKSCLANVGVAHLAAQRENEKIKIIEQQKVKNRKLALQRGKIAAEKIKLAKQPAGNRVKETRVVTVATQVEDSSDTDSDSSTMSSSSASSVCSVIMVKDKRESVNKRISSKYSPKKMDSTVKFNHKSGEYNAGNYISMSSSTSTEVSLVCSPPNEIIPTITRISDMLKRSPTKFTSTDASNHKSENYIRKTFTLDTSSAMPRSSPPKRTILKPPVLRNMKTSAIRPKTLANKTTTKTNLTKVQQIARKPLKSNAVHFVPQFVKSKPSSDQYKKQTTAPSANNKVQFYDHANRFQKEYERNISLVEEIEDTVPLNAMQEAAMERKLEQNYLKELAGARKMDKIREKHALEKEKIRKDYDLMAIQLDDVMKDETLAKKFLRANEILSETRLKEISEERQKYMETDFNRILKEPALITCPNKINESQQLKENRHNDANINVGTTSRPTVDLSDLSTESCNSFLLEYVSARTNDLATDIGKCRTGAKNDENNRDKIDALTTLLNKVNAMRDVLCNEIKRNETKINFDYVMNEMNQVEFKQNEIMSEPRNTKGNIEKHRLLSEREKILKMKEQRLEEKVKELYLREKKLKNHQEKQLVTINTKAGNTCVIPSMETGRAVNDSSLEDIPIRIVINVNKNEKSVSNAPKDKKWSQIIGNTDLSKPEQNKIESNSTSKPPGKVYRKTPVKRKSAPVEASNDISSPSTTLTAYLSPPEAIQTDLSKVLKRNIDTNKRTEHSASTKQIQNPINTQNLNPQLMHYITRLLGMSRTSIEQLNISSVSTVSTPSTSIINVSENRKLSFSSVSTTKWPEIPQIPIDQAKLEQLTKFIAENQNFIDEINDSVKQTSVNDNNRKSNDNAKKIEGVWGEVLPKKLTKTTTTSENEKLEENANTEPKPKSIMRKRASSKLRKSNDNEVGKNDLITKYDELTANCTKRIIDLDSMLTKVREEKQKLLENTLSSASSLITGQKENITEYLDFPSQHPNGTGKPDDATITLPSSNKSGDSSHGSDTKGLNFNTPSPEFSSSSGGAAAVAIANKTSGLLATRNKQFGESKDSGVGNSRPVTSSDYRESPDLRLQTNASKPQKHLHSSERNESNDFEPLLKDIPKVTYRISDIIQSELHNEDAKTNESATSLNKERPSKPPPSALTRYSPHMEEEMAHELSTITEVDTPATSRLNATDLTAAEQTTVLTKIDLINQSQNKELLEFLYKHFPDFQAYARSTSNLAQNSCENQSINLTATASIILGEKLEKLLEISSTHSNALNYKTFQSKDDKRNSSESKQLSQSNENMLSYLQFPTHSDYARAVPGLLDSQSIDQLQLTESGEDRQDNETNSSSLPDIVSELKNRNILKHSFKMDSDDESRDILYVGAGCSNDKKKQLAKQQSQQDKADKQSGSLSDTLEQELQSMGISWASSMLKKTKEVNTISSSSTSSTTSMEKPAMPQKPSIKNSPPAKSKPAATSFIDGSLTSAENVTQATTVLTQTDHDAHTKPINLKEFLARELMKHSSSSSSASDSSLASIFLKSFLGVSSSSSSVSIPSTPMTLARTVADKQRTSTPVNHSSTSGSGHHTSISKVYQPHISDKLSSPQNDQSQQHVSDLTNKLFSGDSHLSSVHVNSSSSTDSASKSNTLLHEEQRKHNEFDALIVPTNLQLNLAGPGSTATSSSG